MATYPWWNWLGKKIHKENIKKKLKKMSLNTQSYGSFSVTYKNN